jgi:hypothetical protein
VSDNVVEFDGITRLDTPPARVLARAVEVPMQQVVVIGFDEEGEFYFASSQAGGGDVLWLLALAKKKLLDLAEEMSGLEDGDTGSSVDFAPFGDRSVQVVGTFGAEGNLRVEGSNDGSNWAVLHDPQGDALDLTAAGIVQVLEMTRFLRPHVTGGDETTDLTVVACFRRTGR